MSGQDDRQSQSPFAQTESEEVSGVGRAVRRRDRIASPESTAKRGAGAGPANCGVLQNNRRGFSYHFWEIPTPQPSRAGPPEAEDPFPIPGATIVPRARRTISVPRTAKCRLSSG